jgi:uncharacterized repeat protein (TIGR03803 family)
MDAANHETVLYNFTGGANGKNPGGSLARDSDGNIYGIAAGVPKYHSVVYKVVATGHETVLCSFGDIGLTGGVIREPAGNLYGTTSEGGSAGSGTVFKLSPSGQETVLYNFTGAADGGQPYTGVALDSAGNLYGITLIGGAGFGTVFKVNATGQETTLYSFTKTSSDGYYNSSLVIDSAGNLYGTTGAGGLSGCYNNFGCGTVYQVDPSGQYTLLYSFTGGADGGRPSRRFCLTGPATSSEPPT